MCIQLHNYDLFEKAQLKLSPLIKNRVQPDYLPKSYARHLPSYQTPSPEPLWVTLGMGKNPTQQPKIYSFPPSEKSPLIGFNLSLSKVSFLPHQTAIFNFIACFPLFHTPFFISNFIKFQLTPLQLGICGFVG